MAYSIRFKQRARVELDECCDTYGEAFRTDIWNWLKQIAESVESGNSFDSIDLIELLDEATQQDVSQWRNALRRWWQANFAEKIKAVLAVLKNHCPPWELKLGVAWLPVLGRFNCEVHAHFLVDHVKRQVVFVLFDGLPGQS